MYFYNIPLNILYTVVTGVVPMDVEHVYRSHHAIMPPYSIVDSNSTSTISNQQPATTANICTRTSKT